MPSSRLAKLLENAREKIQSLADQQRTRNAALFLGGIAFLIGLILALKSEPHLVQDINWIPASLVLALGVPLTMLANSLEFKLSGASMQRRIPLRRALEISTIASAANLLPLPGGLATRVAALKSHGIAYRDGIAVNFLFMFLWVALAFSLTGGFVWAHEIWLASLFLGVGLLFGGASYIWAQRRSVPLAIYGMASLQRLAMLLIETLRIWLCLLALDIEAGLGQAAVFVIGGVVGSAAALVPAGLGIREGVSAGLAPFIGLSASAGFLATALNRVIGMLFLAPVAISISLAQHMRQQKGGG